MEKKKEATAAEASKQVEERSGVKKGKRKLC